MAELCRVRAPIEEACKPGCKALWTEYDLCTGRIVGHENKNCAGQYFEWLKCIDKCVRAAISSAPVFPHHAAKADLINDLRLPLNYSSN
jgi:ubiquinol-cytochrome c reductase subunit 6